MKENSFEQTLEPQDILGIMEWNLSAREEGGAP